MSATTNEPAIDEQLKDVHAAAAELRNFTITFLTLLVYVGLIIASTTHEQILRISPVKLPLLDVEIPLVRFYQFMPVFLFVMHLYILVQHYLFSQQAFRFESFLRRQPEVVQARIRRNLGNLPFLHWLLGRHGRIVRLLMMLISVLSIPELAKGRANLDGNRRSLEKVYGFDVRERRVMNDLDWLSDGRKIPDEVMYYIRVMAVNAVRMLGLGPEEVARTYNFNRHCIYRWLNQYDAGGFEALKSEMPPGAPALVTASMDEWLDHVVESHSPLDFGYDTNLWTCALLVDLLHKTFAVTVSESTVRLHLKALGLSPQKPEYRDAARDESEIERFLDVKFPQIQRLAERIGADIGFQDEAGVGIRTRYGRTWGKRGKTPIVNASMKRGGFNVLSVVTAEGTLNYSVKASTIDSAIYVDFLRQLIQGRTRPLILLADHATFHRSKAVRDFVRQHRTQLRIFFLPKYAPEYNPDEQVGEDVKVNRIGKQPVKNKKDLKKRLDSALKSLQKNTQRILSFFQLPTTTYAAQTVPCES